MKLVNTPTETQIFLVIGLYKITIGSTKPNIKQSGASSKSDVTTPIYRKCPFSMHPIGAFHGFH